MIEGCWSIQDNHYIRGYRDSSNFCLRERGESVVVSGSQTGEQAVPGKCDGDIKGYTCNELY